MKKNHLKNRRKQLGLTLLEVANSVGVSEGTVSRWENGHIENMRNDKAYLLAKVLKASPLWVMGLDISHTDIELMDKLVKVSNDYVNISKDFFDEQKEIKDKIQATAKVINELTELNSSQMDELIKYIHFLKSQNNF